MSLIAFVVPRLIGSPADVLLPPTATQDDVIRLEQLWGLDQPLPLQYLRFVANATTGNFGDSFVLNGPAAGAIGSRLPVTLALAGFALLIVIPFGVALGVISAVNRGRTLDRVIRAGAFTLQGIPSFWLGILLIWLFVLKLRMLPLSGGDALLDYVLPAIVLAHFPLAALLRLTRKEALEVLQSDFVDFARMKGLSESAVVWKHMLRNSLIAPMTYAGFLVASLLTGTVIVETIFALPGVGQLAVQSIQSRDYAVIQALLMLFAFTYVASSFLVDILYGVADPRIRRPA